MTTAPPPPQTSPVALPRIAITYCTQCRWLLRAAYFAQELLSTFGTQIGEVALLPATGGLFTVELTYVPNDAGTGEAEAARVLLWDRKAEGGFPETKVLKQRVRDCVDPKRDLGHSDVGGKKKAMVEGEGKRGGESEGKVGGAGEEETGGATEEKVKEMAQVQRTEEAADAAVSTSAHQGTGGIHLERNPDGTVCEDCR